MPLMLEGKVLAYDRAFTTANGTQYPAGWLRSTTLAQKQAIGISEVPVAAKDQPYNQKFYWGRQADGTLIPKELDELKTRWTEQQKSEAASKLSSSDWLVVRKSETSEAVPADTLTYRGSIRTTSGEREAQINACATVEELVALLTNSDTMRQDTYQTEQVDKVDADGNPVLDADGNQVKETQFVLDGDGEKIVTGQENVANSEPFIKRWPAAPA